MKLLLILSVVVASSSLAGLNLISDMGKTNQPIVNKQRIVALKEKCIIVRQWEICSKYSVDGICCISVINK